MKTLVFDQEDLLVLRSIVRHRDPGLYHLLDEKPLHLLEPSHLTSLRNALRLEFEDTGLWPDRTRTPKGAILHELISRVETL